MKQQIEPMRWLTNVLVLGVFAGSCLLARAMLTLMLEVRNAGRGLLYFTGLMQLIQS